jgi:uncharacterized NAD-dependent epimerase/dehydratase family protein
MSIRHIQKPYLLLVGDEENPKYAKTALGLRDWAPEACLAQLRFTSAAVDLQLPQMAPGEAAAAGAKTLVIGIAAVGGSLPDSWRQTILEALNSGLDVAAGLHQRLARIPEFASVAARLGRQIHDVRHTDTTFPVGTGRKRSGRRLLTVGTDCALGKKYERKVVARVVMLASARPAKTTSGNVRC